MKFHQNTPLIIAITSTFVASAVQSERAPFYGQLLKDEDHRMLQFDPPCPPPFPPFSDIVDTQEKCDCFYPMFFHTDFDPWNPLSYILSEVTTDETTFELVEVGKYTGPDAIYTVLTLL